MAAAELGNIPAASVAARLDGVVRPVVLAADDRRPALATRTTGTARRVAAHRPDVIRVTGQPAYLTGACGARPGRLLPLGARVQRRLLQRCRRATRRRRLRCGHRKPALGDVET